MEPSQQHIPSSSLSSSSQHPLPQRTRRKKQALPYVSEVSKSGLLNSRNWQILEVQSPKKDACQILPSPTPKRLQFNAFQSLYLLQKGCIFACIYLHSYSVCAQKLLLLIHSTTDSAWHVTCYGHKNIFAYFSNLPVTRCSFTAFKPKTEEGEKESKRK